jgi:hypothetical protein
LAAQLAGVGLRVELAHRDLVQSGSPASVAPGAPLTAT